jgi:hypothetical protein
MLEGEGAALWRIMIASINDQTLLSERKNRKKGKGK